MLSFPCSLNRLAHVLITLILFSINNSFLWISVEPRDHYWKTRQVLRHRKPPKSASSKLSFKHSTLVLDFRLNISVHHISPRNVQTIECGDHWWRVGGNILITGQVDDNYLDHNDAIQTYRIQPVMTNLSRHLRLAKTRNERKVPVHVYVDPFQQHSSISSC